MTEPLGSTSICVVGENGSGVPTAALLGLKFEWVRSVDLEPRWNSASMFREVFREPSMHTLLSAAMNRPGFALEDRVERADVFFLCIPDSTWSRSPSAEAVQAVLGRWLKVVTPSLAPGGALVLESLVPPGTTDGPLRDLLSELVASEPDSVMCSACTARPVGVAFQLYDLVSSPRVIGVRGASSPRVESVFRALTDAETLTTEPLTAEIANIGLRLMTRLRQTAAFEIAAMGLHHGVVPAELLEVIHHADQLGANRKMRTDHVLRHLPDRLLVSSGSPARSMLAVASQRVQYRLIRKIVSSVRSLVGELKDAKVAILAPDLIPGLDHVDCAAVVGERLERAVAGCKVVVARLPGDAAEPNHLAAQLQDSDLLLILCGPRELASVDPRHVSSVVRHRLVFDPLRVLEAGRWTECDLSLRTEWDDNGQER
jgi:UDP-N-acetyl-D-mannosaminuronic acid dehydrogenase